MSRFLVFHKILIFQESNVTKTDFNPTKEFYLELNYF